jgi:hypothetical protein
MKRADQLPGSCTAFLFSSLIIGTIARAVPLFDLHGRALTQFPSEDGYLMLTIARNLALGKGLSIEDGTTLTNGTQPFMTGLYGALFWLVDGDKTLGVVLVQLAGLAIAMLGALLVYRVASILFEKHPHGSALAAVASGAWYVSALSARFTQNCLETGAAALLPMIVGLYLLRNRLSFDEPWPIRRCLTLGGLLGLAFWVRNDAVLLSVAVCSMLVATALIPSPGALPTRLFEASIIGTTALIIVSPWLIYNYELFGSIVPVSGISQRADAIAENLARVPAVLTEQIAIVGLIPGHWERKPFVYVLCAAIVIVWSTLVYRETRTLGRPQRHLMAVLAAWAALLVAFYGLVYGAGHFMARYLFPLSPWVAILSVWVAYGIWVRAGSPMRRVAQGVALSGLLLLGIGLDVRLYRNGTNNGHFQVIQWVERHVPDETWVAAIQTGTLGFFHDRTYNLDGKVSPPALAARLEGRTFEYVLARPIQYLVDWVGIATWLDDPRLSRSFELVLVDESKNLAVARRLDSDEVVAPSEASKSD